MIRPLTATPLVAVPSVFDKAVDRVGDPVLALKIMPPRARKHVLTRARLDRRLQHQADVPVVIIEAPTGYGKTVLLSQWRRVAMAEGAAGAWLRLDEHDDDHRLLSGIAMAVRQATGRPGFAAHLEHARTDTEGPQQAAAALLAEWSRLAHPVTLVLDDFDRLTNPAAHGIARYLIANLPPNGRILLGARAISDHPWLLEMQAYGQLLLIDRSELAFTLEESIAFLKERLAAAISINIAAQLHDRTGGWPIGLELFVATLDRAKETPSVLTLIQNGTRRFAGAVIDEGFRNVASFVIKSAVDAYPQDMALFLTEISILELLNPQLCAAVTQRCEANEMIGQLRKSTPLIVDREDDWFELHHIGVSQLREQAAKLPAEHRQRLHLRAAAWLMRHECWEAATQHALEAGDAANALDCIEKCADSLLAAGKIELLDQWFRRLPESEIRARPHLRLALAFRMAIKGEPEHAALIEDLACSTEPRQRFTAAVVRAVGAMHVDDPDRAMQVLTEWRERTYYDDPVLLRSYYNVRKWLDTLNGLPRKHRQWGEGASPALGKAALAGAETLHANAVNHLKSGQPLLASRLLTPALARFDESLGRRSNPALMTAITLAAVATELDDHAQVRTLLADRIDRIDSPLLPEITSMGYIATANLAVHDGQPNRALDHLEVLFEHARTSAFPRIQAIAGLELIKFHAAAGRFEPCERILTEFAAIAADVQARRSLNTKPVLLLWHLATAHTACWANKNTELAAASCETAIDLARAMHHRRLEFEARMLRAAVVYDQCGEISPDLAEVVNLARELHLNRLLREAEQFLHPALRRAIHMPMENDPGAPLRVRGADGRRERAAADVSAMMTARELEVLHLLSRRMSNKEIAIALDIGAGTIKWHLKNLFLKIQATDRKQAVARARILGLIDP